MPTPTPTPTPDLLAGTKFFAVIRSIGVILVVGALLVFSQLGDLTFDPRPILLYLVPAYFAAGFLLWFFIRRSSRPEWALMFQLFLDAAALTAGIELTGGRESPFLPMYFIVIISASLISLRATAIMTAVVLAGYGWIIHESVAFNGEVIDVALFIFITAIIGYQSYSLISQVRDRDRELAKQKEDFLFRTVHDIRSPVTVIRYSVEGTRDPSLPPAVLESYDEIERSVKRINNMVTELMKIARGEASAIAYALRPVALSDVVGKLVKNLQAAAKEQHISLMYARPEGLPPVMADADRLEEALANLIENGIKYNRPDGSVTVRHERDGDHVLTIVQDTGIGIAPGNLEKLFQPYFREARDKDVSGTGLGLFAVRKLVEGMGGTVSVVSTVGVGSTFTVSLPAARAES